MTASRSVHSILLKERITHAFSGLLLDSMLSHHLAIFPAVIHTVCLSDLMLCNIMSSANVITRPSLLEVIGAVTVVSMLNNTSESGDACVSVGLPLPILPLNITLESSC